MNSLHCLPAILLPLADRFGLVAIFQALFIPASCRHSSPLAAGIRMEPIRPFSLRQLRVQAWQVKKLPLDQRRAAGKSLLVALRRYLEKLNANLPRSDL